MFNPFGVVKSVGCPTPGFASFTGGYSYSTPPGVKDYIENKSRSILWSPLENLGVIFGVYINSLKSASNSATVKGCPCTLLY